MTAPAPPEQALILQVGQTRYAVDILRVLEVRRWLPVTRVPGRAERILGVINVRGTIVPVIDLRVTLEAMAPDYTKTTVIALVRALRAETECCVGLVVDAVDDVVDISRDALQPLPEGTADDVSAVVVGLLPSEDGLIMLVDADRLMTGKHWEQHLDAVA